MIRYGRRNAVVPIMERIVEDDLISESDEERLIHFPFGFIHLVHNLSKDFQTFLRHGICSPAAGISDGEEWSSAPRAGYLGEEAVLNGVELGAVGRVVHDEDPHAKAVGKIHEVLLEDTVSAGVGTAAVAEDDKHFRMRVEPFHVAVPDTLYVLAHELGSVVAGAYREVSRVVCHVVDAVRHNRASGESLEVMVESLWRRRAVHLAVPLEVSGILLLLGVHADYGDSCLNAGRSCRVNLQKLRVPVLHLAQRKAFGERPPLEACSLYHLPHDIFGHVMSSLKKLAANLRDVDIKPDNVLILRKTRHVLGDNVIERCHPFGMPVGFLFGSAARHALPAVWWNYMVEKFINSLGNGIWRTSKSLAYSPYRASFGARRLACNKMPSIAFFKCCKVFHFRLANFNWRFLLHHCNDLEINYKDTKISPVFTCLKC